MVNRASVSVVVAALGFASAASAQTWGSSSPRPDAARGRTAAMATATISPVEALLASHVASVDWEEMPFEDVLEWLRDEARGKVNIVPRWNALGIEDVDPDKVVERLKLQNTTVRDVLVEVLGQVSDTGEVTFHGEGNTLRISTKQDLNRNLVLRIYDVTDILFRVPDFSESAPQIDLRIRSSKGGGGGTSRPIFTNTGGQNSEELSEDGDDEEPEEILDELAVVIEDVIEPMSWDTNGGLGRIRRYGTKTLLVLNTVEAHEKIAGFFARHR